MGKRATKGILAIILIFCLSGCTFLGSRQLWRNWRTANYERRTYLDNMVSLELPTYSDEYSENKDQYSGWVYTKWKGPIIGDIPASEIQARGGDFNRQNEDGKGGLVYDAREENILYVEKFYKKMSRTLKGFKYYREAFIIVGNKYFKFVYYTDCSDYMLPDVEEKKIRIKEDDKLFSHILESFRLNKDGQWVKPRVIWKGPKVFEYVEDK